MSYETVVNNVFIPLLALAASSFGCASIPSVPAVVSVETAPVAKPVVDDGQHLVDDMAAAEKMYEEQHDPSAILAFFAPDVVVYAGRGEKPDATDTKMDYRTFSAVYIWAAKFDTKMAFRYEDPELSVKGTKATMQWKTFHDAGGPSSTWCFIQRFEYELRAGRWQIVKYRYWPILPESGEEYDFAALDQQVEASRASHDDRNLARNQMLAYRFKDSAATSRHLTEEFPSDPWCWDMRAKASAMVGDLDDAEKASKAAAALRDGGSVPEED